MNLYTACINVLKRLQLRGRYYYVLLDIFVPLYLKCIMNVLMNYADQLYTNIKAL